MTDVVQISFSIRGEGTSTITRHRLGNIADDVWKEKLYLKGGEIIDGRYIATMIISDGVKLRKKEKDILLDKLKALDPKLEAKFKIKNES